MRNITANAILNLKEKPKTLCVHGSIITYRHDDIVKIEKVYPQGINPAILLLDLSVIEGKGPMKGEPKHFIYRSSDDEVKNFNQVQIRYGDQSRLFNIDIIG